MNTTRTQQHGCDSSSPTDRSPTAMWTTGPSPKSPPPTSGDTPNIIGSAASQAGPSHSGLLDGLTTALSGLLASLASPSAPQESSSEPTMSDTSPPSSLNSSASAALQESLESRLLQNLHGISGSPEYVWSLKRWDTPSGPSIFALRARARSEKDGLCVAIRPLGSASSSDHPTSDNGFTGWPTPDANAMNLGESLESFQARQSVLKAKHGNGNGAGMPIAIACQLAPLSGWPTPCAGDEKWRCSTPEAADRRSESGKQMSLEVVAHITGWFTPAARDWKDTSGMSATGVNPDGSIRNRLDQLGRQVGLCSPAETARPAALNPAFSRWLQAYPVEWCQAAIRAHRSMPTTRRKRGA